MKIKYCLPLVTVAMLTLASCGNKPAPLTAGIDLADLDTTAVPGNDFYQYACGGWMKAHPLTAEYSQFGTFNELRENNRKQLHDIITSLAAPEAENTPGSIEQKIGDLYNIAMDSTRLNSEGMEPVRTDMGAIRVIKEKDQILPTMDLMMMKGIPGYFGTYVSTDMMNSTANIVGVCQGGITLGEKEYYLDNDAKTKEIREKYKEYIVNLFKLFGVDEYNAKWNMEAVMEIETRLAKASLSAVELRNPANSYHKMTLDELKKEVPGINWDVHFQALGIDSLQELSLDHPVYLKEVADILNNVDLDKQKA